MKNYERPTVIKAGELAEGVYMLSGDNMVTLEEVFEPVTDTDTEAADEVAAETETADGLENSVGGTEPEVDGEITEMPADNSTETVESSEPSDESAQMADTAGEADDTVEAAETGEVQVSVVINCDSKYMNGIWQGAKEGAWGGVTLGCKEVFGCTGCPADNGDGCGLQNADSSQYFQLSGTLMPAWEASGKGPNDDPYGI